MSRPKSDDPKLPLTVRVRTSIVSRLGDDVRRVIERLIEERYGHSEQAIRMQPLPALHRDVIGFTASGEEIRRPAVSSRPKPVKR